MENILIGQVSYLPDNELRTKRFEAARSQIDFMHNLLLNVKIVSVGQNYHDSEYVDGVLYRKYSEPLGAGKARNVILEEFYHSEYDWLLLCDDDTIFYDYYYYQQFLYEICENPVKFSRIDAVSPVEPEYHPYKKLNYEDRNNLTHYKFEPRELNSGSATSLIRNIKKFYGKEVYYPDTDANKGEGREDIEFLIAWLLQGLNWYTMQTWIRKSLCFDQSSIFGSDTKRRDEILMHDLDVVCDKFAKLGLQRQTNGKITWVNFNNRFNKTEKLLYIIRERPIEFDENTTPKKKVTMYEMF